MTRSPIRARHGALISVMGCAWPNSTPLPVLIAAAERLAPPPESKTNPRRSAASRKLWATPKYRATVPGRQSAGQRRRFGTGHLTDAQYANYRALITAHYGRLAALAIVEGRE